MQRTVFLALIGAIAFAAGCGNGQQDDEILILCGNSFRLPMERLEQMYEKETGEPVTLSFGGSEDLFPHVRDHVMGDIFVSHDPYMQRTEDKDAMLRCAYVGYAAPVLVVKKGNPKNIEKFEDLARPGLRVILTDPKYSDAGILVFALMEKKQIKEAVLENVGNALVRNHSSVAMQIELDHRDVGVMWNGVAHQQLDAVEIIPTPYEYDRDVRVGVMGLSYSKKRDKVQRFLEFVEKHGETVFKEFGYVK